MSTTIQLYRVISANEETGEMLKDDAIRYALRKVAGVRPFQDDDSFNDYAVLQLEKGEMVCGVRLV